MAESKAEDDDDEGFGDFTSASFRPHPFGLTHATTTTTASASASAGDDDWGDFVEYTPKSHSPNALSDTKSPPPSRDPIGFSSDHSRLVKRTGALPLSIFGVEAEDEEDSGLVDPPVLDVKNSSFAAIAKSEMNPHLGVGINDGITNMYNHNSLVKSENEFDRGSNGLMIASSEVLPNENLGNENGLISTSYDLGLLSVGLKSSDLGQVNEEFDGDYEGWEFKDAYLESKLRARSDKGHLGSSSPGSMMDQEKQAFSELVMNPLDFGSGSHAPIDLFVENDGFPGYSQKMTVGFKSSTVAQNGFLANSLLHSGSRVAHNVENSHPLASGGDSDEDFGEFEAASSEIGLNVKEFSPLDANPMRTGSGSHGHIDLFTVPNEHSSYSAKRVTMLAQSGIISDLYFPTELKDSSNELDSEAIVKSDSFDGNIGDFEAAVSGSQSGLKGNETKPDNLKDAVSLSVFGTEELETDDSLDTRKDLIFKPISHSRPIQSQSSNLPITDILSDLYSQPHSDSAVDSKRKPDGKGLDCTDGMLNSNIPDCSDDFDAGSWEFQDASSHPGAENWTALSVYGDIDNSFASNLKLNDCLDFYRKLKDDLCLVARCHFESLKRAQSTADLSGDAPKVVALGQEIQEVFKELHQEIMISEEAVLDEYLPEDVSLGECLEVLRELKFQVVESEYQLIKRLTLAESDLISAIELIKHSTGMLKILTEISVEEQLVYVTVWHKVISICAQELRHGAWIWKLSLEENVFSELISKPLGKENILSLGEIFRAALIVGASIKVYKPWILAATLDSNGIEILLEECHTLWLTSGLDEALANLSDPVGSKFTGSVKSLLDSIKHLHHLDSFTLVSLLSAHHESLCSITLLPSAVVPGMNLVAWNGKNYFLTLANLWANLISSDPPEFPRLHAG